MAKKTLVNFYKDSERNYEICLLINQKLSEKDLKTNLETIKKIIEKNNGKVVSIANTKIKDFAYPVSSSKEKKGYYACLYTKINPDKINELEKIIRLEDNVLRVGITLANPKKQSYGIFSGTYENSSIKNKNNFISYDDPNNLLRFIGERGKIINKKKNTALIQKQVSRTIKFARKMAILPFIED